MYHNLRFWDTFGHYSFLMKARTTSLRDTGASISPTNAFLLLQGIETLALRMDRHVANAKAVADYLAEHPQVAWVSYAARKDHPDHELAKKYLPKGPGAVLSFGKRPRRKRRARSRKKFIESSTCGPPGELRGRPLARDPSGVTTHQQLSEENSSLRASAPNSSAFPSASRPWRIC
jgi:O-acetylhomoserine (thiol)-lyase